MPPDISIIVTAHREGTLAHRSLRSIFRAQEYARKQSLKSELVIVLDRPDAATQNYFSQYQNIENIQLLEVDYGDPGLSRNHGIQHANGSYIAILDADDLFCQTWLAHAFETARNTAQPCVLHPQYSLLFGAQNLMTKHVGLFESNFRLANLIEHNYWIAHCFGSKSIFLNHPYEKSNPEEGFGYEDWHFYCELIAHGISIQTVPNTVLFVRRKHQGSRLLSSNQLNNIMPATRLFDPDVFIQKLEEEKRLQTDRQLQHLAIDNRLLSTTAPNIPADEAEIPFWLYQEWKNIHLLEPQLFPSRQMLDTLEIYQVPHSSVGEEYADLCQQYGPPASHVFLLPWLKHGGSDRVSLNYLKTLTTHALAQGIVVIATQDTVSTRLKELPPGVRFIPFGEHYKHLTPEAQEKLLLRLLLQQKPSVIHNINSDLGYRIFSKYGKSLANLSRLFNDVYCEEITVEGEHVGYLHQYLFNCLPALTQVFSDNQAILDKIQTLYGESPERFKTHYHAIDIPERTSLRPQKPKKKLDILWASRLDQQKRPDLLLKIIQQCQNGSFHFHIYGYQLLNQNNIVQQLQQCKNVTYHGFYKAFEEIPTHRFDVFLYTSEFDGLPNVLLEAMAHGLPIVAPNIGGIPELIQHGKTGYLIDPFDNVNAYVNQLMAIYKNPDVLEPLAEQGLKLLKSRHSWSAFAKTLQQNPNYTVLVKPQHKRSRR